MIFRASFLVCVLILLGFAFTAYPRPAQALECSLTDPDYCVKCLDIEKLYKGRDINHRTVRGRSVWSPLYAAYFRDCPEVAVRFIQLGAHPAIGGMEGDLLATVISWDRWEVEKRSVWVKMLVLGGARLDSPPITNRTTRDRLMQEYGPRDDISALIRIAEEAGG